MPRNHIKVDGCKIKTRRNADKSTQGPLTGTRSSLPVSDMEDAEMKRDVKAGARLVQSLGRNETASDDMGGWVEHPLLF